MHSNLERLIRRAVLIEPRAHVNDARRRAAASLAAELRAPVPSTVHAVLGMPSAAEAGHIVAAMQRDLWQANA